MRITRIIPRVEAGQAKKPYCPACGGVMTTLVRETEIDHGDLVQEWACPAHGATQTEEDTP